MNRTTACWLAALLVLPLMAGAQTSSTLTEAQSQAQTALRLERRLLSLDLVSYNEVRERERRARERVNEVLNRLDQALAGDAVSLGTLESLQDELATAREASHTAEERVNGQLERLEERLRRIAVLEGDAAAGRPQRTDPLTGRWRVTVLPQNAAATFDLRLNGTVVSGTYQVAGGSAGSFRGTYTGGNLRLERLDARGGFDSVWEGAVGSGRMAGTWMANELVTGQPNRGTWTAVREGEQ
jgi:hypothetical protein